MFRLSEASGEWDSNAPVIVVSRPQTVVLQVLILCQFFPLVINVELYYFVIYLEVCRIYF